MMNAGGRSISLEECAQEVVDGVLLLMHSVYVEVKNLPTPDLSMSQFRALAFLKLLPGVSLSEVAAHIGITLASTSKMIDGLVARNLVMRRNSSTDRRYITLTLTEQGQSLFESARHRVEIHLAGKLKALPEAERATVMEAMQALRPIFMPGQEAIAARAQDAQR